MEPEDDDGLDRSDGESDAAREERLRRLWRQLNPKQQASLDLPALQAGLARMHHPLTHADGLVRQLLHACDLDHDGRVSYSEFVRFCHRTEAELWRLFQSIDRDHNGRLDEKEIKVAFERAGVNVDDKRLDRFFGFVDKNHDGEIDFAEWRDFLLFLPTNAPGMRQVMSFYTSTARMSAEGDMDMSHEALTGLGTTLAFFASPLFGGINRLLQPLPRASCLQTSTESDLMSREAAISGPNTIIIPADLVIISPPFTLTDLVPDVGYFLAGGISGITSRTVTAPLDRLKVYLIAQTGDNSSKQMAQAVKSGAAVQVTKQASATLWNACRELWAAGGVKSLFAGNGINVVKVMPESGVKFGCYEASKRAIARLEGHDDTSAISPLAQFAAGGIAGMASQAVVYPLDTLKFRVQTSTVAGGAHGTSLIMQTAAQMFRQQGVYGFYRGLTMGLVGMFPYAAIDLFTFETLKKWLVARNLRSRQQQQQSSSSGTANKSRYASAQDEEDALPGNFSLALMGGLSGAIGASAVYPVNLLRTRLQSQGTPGHPRTYTGIVDVTRQTLKGEGWRGLWKGLTPNLLKVVPAVSITYVMYENTKQWLQLR